MIAARDALVQTERPLTYVEYIDIAIDHTVPHQVFFR